MTNTSDDRQRRFLAVADEYKNIIAKACSIYASDQNPFADLYQEVMINLWNGLDGYRGDSKMSTWIYRLAINTCITSHRRRKPMVSLEFDYAFDIPDSGYEYEHIDSQIEELYRQIALLNPIDKAIVMMWLDGRTYEEIANVVGLSASHVGTRMHRAKSKIAKSMKL